MIGLSGTRVVVVDDKDDEALPMLKALAKRGISASYFNPSSDDPNFPPTPLSGIRLAILDMDIVGGGTDDRSKASALVSTLGSIVGERNGPYSVIVWTNYDHLVKLFSEYVFSTPTVPNPVLVFTIDKSECIEHGVFSLETVENKLMEGIQGSSGLHILQAWEEASGLAYTEVTNVLSDLSNATGDNLAEWSEAWNEGLLGMMKTLAREEAGRQLDETNCLKSLYDSLSPLHSDRLERHSQANAIALGATADSILQASDAMDPGSTARLNTMLHLAQEDPRKIAAGNLYLFRYGDTRPKGTPSWDNLFDDLLESNQGTPEIKADLRKDCLLAMTEVSPICDHAQDKVRIPRFIAGFLVPNKHLKKFKKPKSQLSFIWRVGPLAIQFKQNWDGHFHFILSARHIFSSTLDVMEGIDPFARVRSQLLGELQSWSAYYSTRPGVTMLRPG